MRRSASTRPPLVLLALLVTACSGSPQRSADDAALASATSSCKAQKIPRTDAKPLPTPRLLQVSASSVKSPSSPQPHPSLFVTDAEGTVVALNAQRILNATLTLPLDTMSKPQQLIPRALLAEGCTRTEGAALDNWQAMITNYTLADYEAAVAMPHTTAHMAHGHAHGRSHNLTDNELASAEPQLEVSADGRTALRMLQRPSLYVPLVYLRSCHNKLCAAVVYMRRFTRAEWPTHADGARTFVDATAALAGWWRDPAATSLFACAAMPVEHHCGGFPQRCTELDVRAAVVARLEAAAAARPGTAGDGTPLRVAASVDGGAKLRVRTAACDEMRLYVKDGPTSGAAVLALRAYTELSLPLGGPTATTSNGTATAAGGASAAAPAAPRTVWVYRACGPLTAPTELRRSAPIELAPLLLAARAAASPAAAGVAAPAAVAAAAVASPAATLPGSKGGATSHAGHHDERSTNAAAAPPRARLGVASIGLTPGGSDGADRARATSTTAAKAPRGLSALLLAVALAASAGYAAFAYAVRGEAEHGRPPRGSYVMTRAVEEEGAVVG